MKKCQINWSTLMWQFPDYMWREDGAELVGIHKSLKRQVTINDGMRASEDGKWLVHEYVLGKKETKLFTCPKYRDDKKVREEWMTLC